MTSEGEKCLTPVELRQRIGLTQVQLAIAIGKSPSTIAKWEARAVVPKGTPSEIKRLCEIYCCTLDQLIEAFEDIKIDSVER
ncbi:MAG: helix-turn-helix domain-containing protein [Leptolyngbya sp. SIO4C5]|nr:helix-turn-helix domain-containing protein [Leptolyngbya sp. SIO4C5]